MAHTTGHTSGGPAAEHGGSGMERCIAECTNCHATCVSMIEHCLRQGGKHVQPDHIRLLADCAQICQTSADFMLRGSALHAHTCVRRRLHRVRERMREDGGRPDNEAVRGGLQALRCRM